MTASSPLVSVILAAYDAERFLPLAVESVLRQTVADLELVVVDDGSTDATPELLSGIDDPRLVVLRNDERLGLAACLNKALEHARGRYVARLDADDVAFPRRLERQLARIGSAPPGAILGGAALELDGTGRPGALHLMPAGPAAVRWAALFGSPFFHPSVLVERDVLDKHDLRYDAEYLESEDYDLWTRLLAVADGDNLPEPLVLYRVHEGQASRRRRDLQREFQLRVALREIARAAPELTPEQAELAWRVGTGEAIEDLDLDDAATASIELVHAFGRARPDGMRAAREGGALSLARVAARSRGSAGARVLREALRLDPLLPAHAASLRTTRRRLGRAARREADEWLGELQAEFGTRDSRPIRVAAIFPEPTPYRAPLLDRVAALPELDLTVVYAAETVARRTWHVEPRHPAVYLRGMRLPGAETILHHDYPVTPGVARALGRIRPDVVVVSGWSTFVAQAGVACDVQHLARGVVGVDIHHDPTDAQDREHADYILRTVGQHDPHSVALHNPQPRQRRREPIGADLHLSKRQRRAQKRRRRIVGSLDGGRRENLVERPLGVGQVRPNPVIVVIEPGAIHVSALNSHASG